mmetsp:Transcript_6790/g.8568  ORF Transcript_6790/g.8568 Transcript_6790/m.8568 type:complete len:113 (+) Transcript_6790:343-681(+)
MSLLSFILLVYAAAACTSFVAARSLRRDLQPSLFNATGSGYNQVVMVQNDLRNREAEVLNAFVSASERCSSVLTSDLPTINFQTSVDVGALTTCGVDFTFVPGDVVENGNLC